jgi:hypothetical protein
MYIGRSGAILQKIYENEEVPVGGRQRSFVAPKITILSLSPKLGYWGEKQYKAALAYRQAGKTEEADRLSRELRERYSNYAGGQSGSDSKVRVPPMSRFSPTVDQIP